MRATILLGLLFYLVAPQIKAQSTNGTLSPQAGCPGTGCIENWEFEKYNGVNAKVSGCTYFADDDNTDGDVDPNGSPNYHHTYWKISHGTPEIKKFIDPNNPDYLGCHNYAYMWARQTAGEGMFYDGYNFVPGTPYVITIRVYSTEQSGGGYYICAATGLQDKPPTSCGDPVNQTTHDPTVNFTSRTLIANNGSVPTNWYNYCYYFTPSIGSSYNQLWIYPYSTTSAQYNLLVESVDICVDECGGVQTFNTGILPTGTTKRGTVYIGSSYGGTGTVTVSPTAQTEMIAANTIVIKNNFTASITTGSFSASINPCTNPELDKFCNNTQGMSGAITYRQPTNNFKPIASNSKTELSDSSAYAQSYLIEAGNNLFVYPNPTSKDRITLTLLSNQKTVRIRVLSLKGDTNLQTIKKTTSFGKQTFDIDVSKLKDGTYIIQTEDGKTLLTQKFQKIE